MPIAELQATVRFAHSIPIIDLRGEMNAYAEENRRAPLDLDVQFQFGGSGI